MTEHLRRRSRCRLCESGALELVLPIKPTPIADAYIPASRLGQPQEIYPLDLYLCVECGHVQNLDVVDPEILFRDYLYTTASSPGLVVQFKQYAADVVKDWAVKPGSLIVEIGSNDGSLLRFFGSHSMRVLGVDPAREIANQATSSGTETLPEFFTSNLAVKIRKKYGAASIVAANNVFAHADDLTDIIAGIREVLDDDGVFVFEVSYLVDIVDNFLFDTVYHEHVSYHSILPLSRYFERIGMQLIDVKRVSSKGGSIRGFAQKRPEGRRPVQPIIGQMIDRERQRGFDRPAIYENYARQIETKKSALSQFLNQEIAKGSMIAGYGASNTTTTLMWQFELTRKLAFLLDDNPKKHGLYSPGCHIPVMPSEEIYIRQPDITVILAWQYTASIIRRHDKYLQSGGCFVVPLPELRILRQDSKS